MKIYTWYYASDMDTFFHKLECKTYPNKYADISMHWDEDCFFLKRKSGNCFRIIYHKAYTRNSFMRDLNGEVLETPDGVTIRAKLNIYPVIIFFLLFWFISMSAVFLIMLFAGTFFLLIPLFMLILFLLPLMIFKKKSEILLTFMDHLYE